MHPLAVPMMALALLTAACTAAGEDPRPADSPGAIVCSDASPLLTLAGREVHRYAYLRTGRLLPIVAELPEEGDAISIGVDPALDEQALRLRTSRREGRRVLAIEGGSDLAALWGAYRYAEHLGVRFALHGDVLPDALVADPVPELDETRRPLFELRGIQPFHDFPEGPDWWNVDDYMAVLSQLPKLGMNFLGLHCYPEGGVGPEPTVWIGAPEDVGEGGEVAFAYPSRYASTGGGAWGYAATRTSDFAAGAALLFEEDDHGPEVTRGHTPLPQTPEGCLEVFHRTGEMLREAFAFGRGLGISICMGTETPLTIPKAVRERLEAAGADPADPDTVRRLYRGMFERIDRTHPIDWYWLWTPEGWTWQGADEEQVEATVRDVRLALEALEEAGSPFGFATCGWVLGPPGDRARFDRELPASVALSCINRSVGFSPVEPGFSQVSGRGQWAIPWLEDDPAMIIPQLWVGRMRRDAADALAYGCTGLMGIHWRTRAVEPMVASLAAAAWDQSGWNADQGRELELPGRRTADGHAGGTVAGFPGRAIADTEADPVYRTCRYDLDAYRLKLPDGGYSVTLCFCEPHYREAGKRVFGVEIQGQRVLEGLDVFARAGGDRALDFTFEDVEVSGGELVIDFVREVEFPFVAGISVEGRTAEGSFQRRINCGGGRWAEWEEDLPALGTLGPFPHRPRDLSCVDFYADWARACFGEEAAADLARLFARLDGGGEPGRPELTRLPRPSNWISGPGGIVVDRTPWEEVAPRYAFVEEMAALRPKINGAGSLERFDWWLGSFRYLRAVAEIGCLRGRLDLLVERIEAEPDEVTRGRLAREEALPIRRDLTRSWERLMGLQLAVVSTPGGMGTIANLEQHVRGHTRLLSAHDEKLEAWSGEPLPAHAQPSTGYAGPTRILVPTRRSQVGEGESLRLKVIVLSSHPPERAELWWRPLGRGEFQSMALEHRARGVYAATLSPARGVALEYFVEVETREVEIVRWPATAPRSNQTAVVWRAGGS